MDRDCLAIANGAFVGLVETKKYPDLTEMMIFQLIYQHPLQKRAESRIFVGKMMLTVPKIDFHEKYLYYMRLLLTTRYTE